MSSEYIPRSVDGLIDELFRELPALSLVGPRATGKTTTSLRHVASVVRLDETDTATAFQADPDAALRGLDEPVLIDEWQFVPQVLGAVKRSVDADSRPGRFLLTGSVRAELTDELWPGTGRLVRIPMYGLTVRELTTGPGGHSFLDALVSGKSVPEAIDPPDVRGYVELALRSGFPDAARLSASARERWIESYLDQLISRDAQRLGGRRSPELLRRYFDACAINTAGIVHDKALYDSVGISRDTAVAYDELLVGLRVLEKMPAWTTNRLKRLVRSPKRYVVDAALAAAAMQVGVDGVRRSGDLMGRVLDTFVAAQLRAELPLGSTRPRLYHVRDAQGRHEIDLLAETGGQQVIGIEVKAGGSPTLSDARHLLWLRDRLEDQFVAGVVLHTGRWTHELDDRIVAAPIAALWA